MELVLLWVFFLEVFPLLGCTLGYLSPGRYMYWAHPSKFLVMFGPLPLTGLVSKSQHLMEGFWSFCTSVIIWSVASGPFVPAWLYGLLPVVLLYQHDYMVCCQCWSWTNCCQKAHKSLYSTSI